MTSRTIVRTFLLIATVVTIPIVLYSYNDSLAADAPPTIFRPIMPAQPEPDTDAAPQLNTTPNVPPPSSIPGTDAYEINQLRMRIDALSEAINALRQQSARQYSEINATLLSLRRPVCTGESVMRDPVSGATENCFPYGCNRAAGVCRTTCQISADCAPSPDGQQVVCNNRVCVVL